MAQTRMIQISGLFSYIHTHHVTAFSTSGRIERIPWFFYFYFFLPFWGAGVDQKKEDYHSTVPPIPPNQNLISPHSSSLVVWRKHIREKKERKKNIPTYHIYIHLYLLYSTSIVHTYLIHTYPFLTLKLARTP